MIRAARQDAVFIRKSTAGQNEAGQKANVANMLKEMGVDVPEQMWFEGTVGRRKVQGHESFTRLMLLVKADKIGTVYVESQDRWGTADRVELFSLIGTLREHRTRLFDLRGKKDLTENDFTTELIAVINSFKSEKELKDISYRSLRTRVSNFKETGSWPTGTHPFGYGKACYTPDDTLVWVWQPISRSNGQLYYPTSRDELEAVGPPDAKIPRKEKRNKIVLVPSTAFAETVRMVFDLYTRVGLSRRQISARLNSGGRLFYDRPFTHPCVTQILTNPAYGGDTHFGKMQSGELHTFDKQGVVVALENAQPAGARAVADRIVKENTHEPLVDRETWKLAQQKMAAERERISYAPRNPDYYLKQIFVCGHCGKNMTARTENDQRTGRTTVVYVCASYIEGRCNGHASSCGYHRITHDDAERLLMDKIKEFDLEFDELTSLRARENLRERLARLGQDQAESRERWNQWIEEGLRAFCDFLRQAPNFNTDGDLTEIEKRVMSLAADFYVNYDIKRLTKALPAKASRLRQMICKAEETAVALAKTRLAEIVEAHKAYTLAWAKASELQQAALKEETDRLEKQIDEWRPRTVPLSERFEELHREEAERRNERRAIKAEWPKMESREKGEAMRRLFKTVTLYWDATFHPALAKPSRPRTTDRAGRYSYALQHDRIGWQLATSDLGGSW